MALLIPAYLVAILLTGAGVGLAVSLARQSGQRVHQVFLLLLVLNDLTSLAEILLKLFPTRLAPAVTGHASLLSGFVVVPLMAAFSYLIVDWLLTLGGLPFPAAARRLVAAYWGLLFLGFLWAEYRHFEHQDLRLATVLQPFFGLGIAACGLGAAGFVAWRGGRTGDLSERRFVRKVSLYIALAYPPFAVLFMVPLPLDPAWLVLLRGLLGVAYLLLPLRWMRVRERETRVVQLTRLAADPDGVSLWLGASALSPREREIVSRVIEGKANAAIADELFIGVRTVESHLHSIYRKLGVRNRLQLARRAALESEAARRTG